MCDVWVKTENGPEKRRLEASYSGGNHSCPINRLWFKPQLMQTFLEQGGIIDWYHRNSGRARMAGEYQSVFFLVNEIGHINAKCWDIYYLPDWQKNIWVLYNEVPQGDTEQDRWGILPQYPDESRHFERWSNPREAPEMRLLIALAECEAKFKSEFFKRHEYDTELAKNLHRFRSLNEDELRGLAVDLYKYCMERLNKKALRKAILQFGIVVSDADKDKSRKLLEILLQLCSSLSRDETKKITAPLAELYKLRNGGGIAHYPPSGKIENCYNFLGIDRYAPHIEQGAELLEKIAIAFEDIGGILSAGKQA